MQERAEKNKIIYSLECSFSGKHPAADDKWSVLDEYF